MVWFSFEKIEMGLVWMYLANEGLKGQLPVEGQ
jgi:hypothetical protein